MFNIFNMILNKNNGLFNDEQNVMKRGEINNVIGRGRFIVHCKVDRNEFLSAFSGTLLTYVAVYVKLIYCHSRI